MVLNIVLDVRVCILMNCYLSRYRYASIEIQFQLSIVVILVVLIKEHLGGLMKSCSFSPTTIRFGTSNLARENQPRRLSQAPAYHANAEIRM
jgi:hypothetical protein